MKMQKMALFVAFTLLTMVGIGCDSLLSPEDESTAEVVQDVKNFIEAEGDSLFGLEFFDDGIEDNLLAESDVVDGMQKSSLIVSRFVRRSVDEVTRTVEVEVIEPDSSIATIIHSVTGSMVIGYPVEDATTGTTSMDSVTKDFTVSTVRKAIVVKKEFPENMDEKVRMSGRHNGWRLAGMTPTVGTTEGTDLEIVKLTATNVTRDETFEITDPLNTFLTWRDRAHFVQRDSVTFDVDVVNADQSGERVVAHYKPRFRLIERKRVIPFSEETGYQRGFHVRARAGIWRITIDVIDEDLVNDPETAEYNAVFWRLPAFVIPLSMEDRFYPAE